MVKDILVIRFSNKFEKHNDETEEITENFREHFEDVYNVVSIVGENDTDKTEFEIIRY